MPDLKDVTPAPGYRTDTLTHTHLVPDDSRPRAFVMVFVPGSDTRGGRMVPLDMEPSLRELTGKPYAQRVGEYVARIVGELMDNTDPMPEPWTTVTFNNPEKGGELSYLRLFNPDAAVYLAEHGVEHYQGHPVAYWVEMSRQSRKRYGLG